MRGRLGVGSGDAYSTGIIGELVDIRYSTGVIGELVDVRYSTVCSMLCHIIKELVSYPLPISILTFFWRCQ